jgi:2-iminobutanoate/2-iminopropanoate deaminase
MKPLIALTASFLAVACRESPDPMTVKRIETSNAPAAIGPYSQAIVAGQFLFTAGQIALDPVTGQLIDGGIEAQTERVLRNLTAILEAAGTNWTQVVKTTVYLQDLAHFPTVNEIYGRWIGDARPARSTVQVAALPRGALVEIDAIAHVR